MRLFAYRLAEKLGYANVDLMLEEMDAGQLAEWQAYDEWDAEMHERARMAAKAETQVTQLRRERR